MKTILIVLSVMLVGIASTQYSYAPAAGKYTIKSTTPSAKLPSGMAQVQFEFKFKSGCETNDVKLTVDGLKVSKTANAKNPRINTLVKKGKHVFQLTTVCDTVVTETLNMKERTSTSIEVEL